MTGCTTLSGSADQGNAWPMAKILSFKKPSPKEKNQGKTLCLHDFHKWAVVSERKFDVRQGKLVTCYRCQRCGKEKTELT